MTIPCMSPWKLFPKASIPISKNSYYYNDFHSGDEDKLLSDIEEFYSIGIFDHEIVDVIIHAATQALNLNIYTYQECEGHTEILKQVCGITEANVYGLNTHPTTMML